MNRRKLQIILSLFVLNSISLYLYLFSHADHFRRKLSPENHQFLPGHGQHSPFSSAKPWPILPSYLPWSLNSKVPFGSCEGYFGNGFNRRIDLLKSSPEVHRRFGSGGGGGGGGGDGWFRCFYSDTMRSSICEGGMIRMNPEMIKMSIGGERLEEVIGRREDEEMPEFESGAFDIAIGDESRHGEKLVSGDFLDRYVQRGVISKHTMRNLIDSVRLVGASDFHCSEWVEEPTLLVTRFEYANLFHTYTDWYSAYVASRVTGLPNRPHLVFVDGHCTMSELDKLLRELKSILYGDGESEPATSACAQLAQEFFRENTLRLLIICLPKLNLEARKDATQVVANLQRQQVHSCLIASEYLETNLDLMDHLISGYEDPVTALHYGGMLRDCIRHQVVARYVLESKQMRKFFDYMQLPNFDVAADATATFKELLTRHKSTVAEFLSRNYDWFFAEFNSKLLESTNYITRRQAIKLLGDMLLDRSNSAVMIRYVSSKDNLRILMNLLRESSKNIQIDAFHVFKLFAANANKPPHIVNILVANRSKLLRFFAGLKIDREDEQFEADKAQVIKEISDLEPKDCH